MTITLGLMSVLIVSLVSLVGAMTLYLNHSKIERLLFILVSMSVGTLFGDAFLHLLPEAFSEATNMQGAAFAALGGVIVFFIFEKFLLWHHHHDGQEENHNHPKTIGPLVLVSDGLHNFIDGLIIATSYLISIPVGIATTIAVICHEIPQEIGDFGLLLHAGYKKGEALLFNFISACLAFVGAFTAFILGENLEGCIPYILSFAAGSFIYIAGSDLVPELHKHTKAKHASLQFISIMFGVLVMVALLFIE